MSPNPGTKVYLHIKTVESKPSLWKKIKERISTWNDHLRASSKSLKAHFAIKNSPVQTARFPQKTYHRKFLPGIRTSVSELSRNPLRSLATIFIIALVLSTLSLAIIVSFLTEEAIRIVNTKLDFSIEVQEDITRDQIQPLMRG